MEIPIIPTKQGAAATATNVATGVVLPLAAELLQRAVRAAFGYNNIKVWESAEVDAKGSLGNAVWMDITLGEASGKSGNWNYTVRGQKESIPVLNILCCIVEVQGTKDIVKSIPMGGSRAGSVKEYINEGDYAVTIKGVLYGANGKYPMKDVKNLKQYLSAPVQIPVVHELLNELGIYEVVIESWNLPARPGFENLQAFELNCVSDYPVELEIKNKKDLKRV